MLGLLGGVTLVGWLPRAIAWNGAFLVGVLAVVLVALATLPGSWPPLGDARPSRAMTREVPARRELVAADPWLVPLVFITGRDRVLRLLDGRAVPDPAARQPALRAGSSGHRASAPDRPDLRHHRAASPSACSPIAAVPPACWPWSPWSWQPGITLIAFGDLTLVAVGCVLLGLAMAGWMLPLERPARGDASRAASPCARRSTGWAWTAGSSSDRS